MELNSLVQSFSNRTSFHLIKFNQWIILICNIVDRVRIINRLNKSISETYFIKLQNIRYREFITPNSLVQMCSKVRKPDHISNLNTFQLFRYSTLCDAALHCFLSVPGSILEFYLQLEKWERLCRQQMFNTSFFMLYGKLVLLFIIRSFVKNQGSDLTFFFAILISLKCNITKIKFFPRKQFNI